eukprot:7735654-Pyramimonas_sp.AAC.1
MDASAFEVAALPSASQSTGCRLPTLDHTSSGRKGRPFGISFLSAAVSCDTGCPPGNGGRAPRPGAPGIRSVRGAVCPHLRARVFPRGLWVLLRPSAVCQGPSAATLR